MTKATIQKIISNLSKLFRREDSKFEGENYRFRTADAERNTTKLFLITHS